MVKTVCVFCSSSEDLDESFYELASKLGSKIGQLKLKMIHGAGGIGLMRRLSEACLEQNGEVIGVIPSLLNKPGIVWTKHTELIITPDMKTRKETMRELSDAFIALPGGFGTLEELLEVITLKQLKYHSKPIVIINQNNFYSNLIKQFEQYYIQGFANAEYKKLYFVTEDIEEAINYITNYKHINIYDKYLKA
jgi:cytokinin riboside 5'-monophosphate phosphoribohydrolase